MDALAKNRAQMFGAWCGLAYLALILVACGLVAGFLPPKSPSTSAAEVGALFASDYARIRIGMVMVMFSALALSPYAALLTQFILARRGWGRNPDLHNGFGWIGRHGAVLLPDMSWLQFIGGVNPSSHGGSASP